MNKQELLDAIAASTNVSKATCKDVIESFIETVEKALKKKDQVVLTGFGTFAVLDRKARVGVNPATGEKMEIPAKSVPKFKPGKKLKDLVA